jgi:hypothetical protein
MVGRDDIAAQGVGTMLLEDIRAVFDAKGVDRLPSNELVQGLLGMTERPWGEARKGDRAINENWLARKLSQFKITSRTIRVDDNTTLKGYLRECFADAWERYLAQKADSEVSKRNTVTTPVNIEPNALFKASHPESMLRFETSTSTNKDGPCGGVAAPKPQNDGNGTWWLE